MAKKTRLKADAFSWVQDTKQPKGKTQEAPKAAIAKKVSEEKAQKPAAKKRGASLQSMPAKPEAQPEIMKPPSAQVFAAAPGEVIEVQRVIFVKFIKTGNASNPGQIVAILEFAPGRESMYDPTTRPWSEIPSNQDSKDFPLTEELLPVVLNEGLAGIHTQYKVVLLPGVGLQLVLINPIP